MQILRTRKELKEFLSSLDLNAHGDTQRGSQTGDKTAQLGLVMTMGALHAGHMSLVDRARSENTHVIVSVYVNPLQFAPGEDFDAYPRQLEADAQLCREHGVDALFAPSDEEMYPREPLVRIDPGPVARLFEGKTRPTHFAGVLQIVNKVLNLVQPERAYFGQKDAQQLALIRTMVADLDMPVEIIGVPIARADSGLALSSRNTYLSPVEKAQALSLSSALHTCSQEWRNGASVSQALAAGRKVYEQFSDVRIDYLAAVSLQTFLPVPEDATSQQLPQGIRFITAAWVGNTRLIDNMEA